MQMTKQFSAVVVCLLKTLSSKASFLAFRACVLFVHQWRFFQNDAKRSFHIYNELRKAGERIIARNEELKALKAGSPQPSQTRIADPFVMVNVNQDQKSRHSMGLEMHAKGVLVPLTSEEESEADAFRVSAPGGVGNNARREESDSS